MTATLRMTHTAIGVEVRRGTYEVFIDGHPAGLVEMNASIDFAIDAGRHTVQVRSGRNASRVTPFTVDDGHRVDYRCTGKSFLPVFVASFFVPGWALHIRQVGVVTSS